MPSALERLRQIEAEQRAAVEGRTSGEPAPGTSGSRRAAIAGASGVALLLGSKAKVALLLVLGKLKLVFAALKLGKLVTTGSSMLLMASVYSRLYGWPFAGGLVLLILVHELGHGLAARAVGMPVGAPVFIPFVGAFIALKERPKSTWQEFVIAAGGPVIGGLGGAACVVLSTLTGGTTSTLLLAVGFFTLVMNLFNLTPIWQLDGHRMLGPVTPWVGCVGLVLAAAATIGSGIHGGHANPIAVIALLVVAWRFGERLHRAHAAVPTSTLDRLAAHTERVEAVPDDATPTQRLVAAATYFGAFILLAGGVHLVFPLLPATPGAG
jgi:Zn-dependent protease